MTATATRTLSGTIFKEMWSLIKKVMQGRAQEVWRNANNHFAHEVPLVYVLSCITLETYVNEFLTMNFPFASPPITEPIEGFYALDLREKYVQAPTLFGMETFDKGKQPFQDFDLLVDLRNDFVHYKMDSIDRTKLLNRLAPRGILLRKPDASGPGPMWIDNLSTYRGALWAADVTLRMSSEFRAKFAPLVAQGKLHQQHFELPSPTNVEEAYAEMVRRFPANVT